MKNTIFTVELPLIETDEELEKMKELYHQYDPYFIVSGCCKDRREKFDKLYAKYKNYKDENFLKGIRTNFHQRTWEMYVGNVLLEKGLEIKPNNGGPDFVINNLAYVECVASTKGKPAKPDSVPEMFVATKPEEIRVQDVPGDKMILRITTVIKDKADQYQKWKSKTWFDSKMPFVIAVNTADLEHVDNQSMPNVLKALFGYQFMQINIKIKTGTTNFSHRNEVVKNNGESVPVNYFTNEDFSFVSGVLFSDKSVLNHPENIGEDCIFVNNPFADNSIDESFIKLFKNWTANKEINLKKNY